LHKTKACLGLLCLSGHSAVIILSALISKHLGHCNGTAWKVWVVVQTLTNLQATDWLNLLSFTQNGNGFKMRTSHKLLVIGEVKICNNCDRAKQLLQMQLQLRSGSCAIKGSMLPQQIGCLHVHQLVALCSPTAGQRHS